MCKFYINDSVWMQIHALLNNAAFLLALAAVIIMVRAINKDNEDHLDGMHGKAGVAVLVLAGIQVTTQVCSMMCVVWRQECVHKRISLTVQGHVCGIRCVGARRARSLTLNFWCLPFETPTHHTPCAQIMLTFIKPPKNPSELSAYSGDIDWIVRSQSVGRRMFEVFHRLLGYVLFLMAFSTMHSGIHAGRDYGVAEMRMHGLVTAPMVIIVILVVILRGAHVVAYCTGNKASGEDVGGSDKKRDADDRELTAPSPRAGK